MNCIDYKVTVWYKVKFDENADMEKIVATLKEEGIESVFDEELGFQENEMLYETEEYLTPEDNGDNATIEVYEKEKLIWNNEPQVMKT